MFGKLKSLFGGEAPKPAEKPVTKSVPDDWNRADKPRAAEPSTMPAEGSVCFENKGVTVSVKTGTSILDVAIEHGVELNHYCGGMASCGSCRITLVSGDVTPKDDMEDATLDVVIEDPRDRLACQTRVRGAVTVIVPAQD